MFNTCLISLVFASLIVAMSSASGIPAEQDFGPIFRPANPTGARNILGYDHFETTKNTKQEIKYGNHWEQFDTPAVQDYRFNAPGSNYNQGPVFNFPKAPATHNAGEYKPHRY